MVTTSAGYKHKFDSMIEAHALRSALEEQPPSSMENYDVRSFTSSLVVECIVSRSWCGASKDDSSNLGGVEFAILISHFFEPTMLPKKIKKNRILNSMCSKDIK